MNTTVSNVLIIGISSPLGQFLKDHYEKLGWAVNERSNSFELVIYLRRYPNQATAFKNTRLDLICLKQLDIKTLIFISTTGLMQSPKEIVHLKYYGIYNSVKLLQQKMFTKAFPNTKILYASQISDIPGYWRNLIKEVQYGEGIINLIGLSKNTDLRKIKYTNLNDIWTNINELVLSQKTQIVSNSKEIIVSNKIVKKNMSIKFLIRHKLKELLNIALFIMYSLRIKFLLKGNLRENIPKNRIFSPTGKSQKKLSSNQSVFDLKYYEIYSLMWH